MNCTYTFTDKTNGKRTSCSRPAFGSGKVCLFHSPDVRGKAQPFVTALAELLASAGAQVVDERAVPSGAVARQARELVEALSERGP